MHPLIKQITAMVVVAVALICLGFASTQSHRGRRGTVNVIYSFAGDEDGEYADTDLETDSAGKFTARQCSEETLEEPFFSSANA
jgi:hypothetical protein